MSDANANAVARAADGGDSCLHAKSASATFPYTYPAADSLHLVSECGGGTDSVLCGLGSAVWFFVLVDLGFSSSQQYWFLSWVMWVSAVSHVLFFGGGGD